MHYTEVGAILSKRDAQKFYNMIRMIIDDLSITELSMVFKSPATSSAITVKWERNEPSTLMRGEWESLSVEYVSKNQTVGGAEELFDSHHTFGEAYELKVV